MTISHDSTSGATSAAVYPGGLRILFSDDAPGFFTIVPPAAVGHPFGARAQPQRDPNAPAMALCFGQNGTIGHRPVRELDQLGFREVEILRAPRPLFLAIEGDAGDARRRRALGRNPFFPTLAGDVYLMGEVENEAYDEDASDSEDDVPDHFLCHVRLAEAP